MPTSLVNMARTPSEREPSSVAQEESKFPFGLSLHLNSDSLDKLGIATLPEVGASFNLMAVTVVEAISEFESEESGKERTLTLQITDMALEGKKTQADTLFGKDAA